MAIIIPEAAVALRDELRTAAQCRHAIESVQQELRELLDEGVQLAAVSTSQNHAREVAVHQRRGVLKERLETLLLTLKAAEAREETERQADAARRLREGADVQAGLSQNAHASVSTAKREQTADAVTRAVLAHRQVAALRSLLWEKTHDRLFHPAHGAKSLRTTLGDELARLSPYLNRAPGSGMIPVDASPWAHLRLEELPDAPD